MQINVGCSASEGQSVNRNTPKHILFDSVNSADPFFKKNAGKFLESFQSILYGERRWSILEIATP